MDAKSQEQSLSLGELRNTEGLKLKDINTPLSQAAKRGNGNRLVIFGKPKEPVTGTTMTEPARRPVLKPEKQSMIPKPAGAPTMKRRADPRMFQLRGQEDGSAMDTDELQWDSTVHHIGMKG